MLMVVGMTIVFSFLLLLVGMLFGMSWLSARLAPEVQAPPAPGGAQADADADLVAAVTAAIHCYRSRHRR
jgi:oxaloacetate decarboxylase (Na+ extruding) subunit gamma